MKHEGRGVIRLGDKTDHGGYVITTSSGTVVIGKEAALADDMTYCPACKGEFAIKPDGNGARHQGRAYAYHNDLTECGARLITSLESNKSASSSIEKDEGEKEKKNVFDRAFDDRFVLLNDETGEPAAFIEYALERENGSVEHGITNERGETHLLSTKAAPENVKIYVAIEN